MRLAVWGLRPSHRARHVVVDVRSLPVRPSRRPSRRREDEWGGMKFHCPLTDICTATAEMMRRHMEGDLYKKMAAANPSWEESSKKRMRLDLLAETQELYGYRSADDATPRATGNAHPARDTRIEGVGSREVWGADSRREIQPCSLRHLDAEIESCSKCSGALVTYKCGHLACARLECLPWFFQFLEDKAWFVPRYQHINKLVRLN